MIEGELKPLSAIQGRYTIITSLKQGATLPALINPIKRMREAFQYTQKQLADLIGCTQKDISRYENGTRSPSAENIQKLSKAFNVSMEEMTILIKHFKDAKEKSPE
jgi:transcriptional regulator with XRE-family HTH domain